MGDLTTPGTFTAFAAGIVSFLSPCVLPLVPGYVSYVAGESLQHRRRLNLLIRYRYEANLIGGAIIIGFGLLMVVLGVAMITGWLNAFSFWLIDTFPVFRAMG